jgi:hypothetical protein
MAEGEDAGAHAATTASQRMSPLRPGAASLDRIEWHDHASRGKMPAAH